MMKSARLRQVAGLLASILLVWIGASQLLQWRLSGGIWVNFKSRGEPNNFQYITYADHPFNFVVSLTFYALLVVMGCGTVVFFVREIRKRFS
jgi:hypothetical protein